VTEKQKEEILKKHARFIAKEEVAEKGFLFLASEANHRHNPAE